jgi:hypothetical protein
MKVGYHRCAKEQIDNLLQEVIAEITPVLYGCFS